MLREGVPFGQCTPSLNFLGQPCLSGVLFTRQPSCQYQRFRSGKMLARTSSARNSLRRVLRSGREKSCGRDLGEKYHRRQRYELLLESVATRVGVLP
jgi:hypothetical protein